ncbi:hypothetical protein TIFTF001_037480 [Ficus carica]|uniref:Uncharacterized protein n=1 Tax=Ficus carica TaxID=3494 RepID=A0AA88E691_FICCA|nr:hypothetical protein TIFTF001_036433 [Ficus carica]GMN68423.1 hypothetical protein TIFTF001_037480 [Ficus carica]
MKIKNKFSCIKSSKFPCVVPTCHKSRFSPWFELDPTTPWLRATVNNLPIMLDEDCGEMAWRTVKFSAGTVIATAVARMIPYLQRDTRDYSRIVIELASSSSISRTLGPHRLLQRSKLSSSTVANLKSHEAIDARRSPPSLSPEIDRLQTSLLHRRDPRRRLYQPHSYRDPLLSFFVVSIVHR